MHHAMPVRSVTDQLPYPVVVESGLLRRAGELVGTVAPAHSYAIITDPNVAEHYAAIVRGSFGSSRVELLTMPAGEENKTVGAWATLSEAMLRLRMGRDTTVVALGGGIVGDVAGFVAATFMRGVPVVQIPTTLVAMVDAAIGGKTGVNTPSGKNLLGAFHQPRAVLVDPQTLTTLPLAELRAGLAEVIKHGVIADAGYFAMCEEVLASVLQSGGTHASLHDIIVGSIAIKSAVVAQDEREGGVRKILNFGHTIGHAIEACLDFRILHGEAVAIGMSLEAAVAEKAGIATPGTRGAILSALGRAELPHHLPGSLAAEEVVRRAAHDKKARAGEIEFALPRRIGQMAGDETGWGIRVPRDLLLQSLS